MCRNLRWLAAEYNLGAFVDERMGNIVIDPECLGYERFMDVHRFLEANEDWCMLYDAGALCLVQINDLVEVCDDPTQGDEVRTPWGGSAL